MKITGLGELFKLLSNSQSRKKLVHYYCLSCGREHNELACPECGSKIKKIS